MRTITLIMLSSASGAIACGLPGYLIGMIFDALHMSLYESDGITYQTGGGSAALAFGEWGLLAGVVAGLICGSLLAFRLIQVDEVFPWDHVRGPGL